MKKIIFKIQFLLLIYILNMNSNQILIDDIYKRSHNNGSKIVKKVKNISYLINLSLIILNMKNIKNLFKKNKNNLNKNNKIELLNIVVTTIWNLIYFRTIHPLFKNRQKIFNSDRKLKDANYLEYEKVEKTENLNIDFIGVSATRYMNKFHFLQHAFGFSSSYCYKHKTYEKDNIDKINIHNEDLIKKINEDLLFFQWNGDVCPNDRKEAGKYLSNHIIDEILNNNKKLAFISISYGSEVVFNTLEDLIKNKKEEFKLKECLLFLITPPINERYLSILSDFLNLNPNNKIITLNNFNEEKLLIDISNQKNLFDFGKSQSDLTLFENKKFYNKYKDKILGLMSIDKDNNKEITHYDLCLWAYKNLDDLINFIYTKVENKDIQFGKNYFLSNFYEKTNSQNIYN